MCRLSYNRNVEGKWRENVETKEAGQASRVYFSPRTSMRRLDELGENWTECVWSVSVRRATPELVAHLV